MQSLVRVATCNLDQWALDFDTNLRNICESIRQAKEQGCTFRTGPELEVPGYGCEDHFWEPDTFFHSWESLATIIDSDLTDGIICDIGMPVLHGSTRYNCRVFVLNRKILFIRPKVLLADDGNYREGRWFTPWQQLYQLDDHVLPRAIQRLTGQRNVPFGMAILATNDSSIACETCEELFTPNSPHIALALNGAEIIANGSGSHHNLRKLNVRMDLINSATKKGGGVYLYANQQGCDGGRLYYDGCALISVNGQVHAQGSQFSLSDVEVITGTIDLEDVRAFRAATSSRGVQAMAVKRLPVVNVDFDLSQPRAGWAPTPIIQPKFHIPEEEIAFGPACWLWDYLRRSGASGFFLPLSGGADSSSTAAIVGIMCNLVAQRVRDGDETVIADSRRVAGEAADSKYLAEDPKEFANRLFHTCYMGTSNSSAETRDRAKRLAAEVGSYHLDVNIDTMVSSMVGVFEMITGKRPQFRAHGGTNAENLALQNIQARLRMVLAYMLAQLLPWVRARRGFLLVLGSANVDEALRGYMTKYDCSSADINPIGGISKCDLKRFLVWAATEMKYPSLSEIVAAPPTAELEPITEDYKQNDEEDMGMTYEELGVYGRLRKIYHCGPVSMYEKLRSMWNHVSPTTVADKVKKFFFYYSINRHKLTTLTPSYHAENYSPDDNRFDHRQFLYNAKWTRQFGVIDRLVEDQISPDSEASQSAPVIRKVNADNKSNL
jgi:NAD+ synthase (glutamine-hydrolysing)